MHLNLRAFGHYALTTVPFDTFVFKSTPQDSLLHPVKQFITSSAFFHLFIKQFALRFFFFFFFFMLYKIGLSHWGSFVSLLFSTKQCRNSALTFKVLNFALIVVFFPVTIKWTHANANMLQSALCNCCYTGNTSIFDFSLAQLTIEHIYCFALSVPSD